MIVWKWAVGGITQANTQTDENEMKKENILAVALLSEKPRFQFSILVSVNSDDVSCSFYK